MMEESSSESENEMMEMSPDRSRYESRLDEPVSSAAKRRPKKRPRCMQCSPDDVNGEKGCSHGVCSFSADEKNNDCEEERPTKIIRVTVKDSNDNVEVLEARIDSDTNSDTIMAQLPPSRKSTPTPPPPMSTSSTEDKSGGKLGPPPTTGGPGQRAGGPPPPPPRPAVIPNMRHRYMTDKKPAASKPKAQPRPNVNVFVPQAPPRQQETPRKDPFGGPSASPAPPQAAPAPSEPANAAPQSQGSFYSPKPLEQPRPPTMGTRTPEPAGKAAEVPPDFNRTSSQQAKQPVAAPSVQYPTPQSGVSAPDLFGRSSVWFILFLVFQLIYLKYNGLLGYDYFSQSSHSMANVYSALFGKWMPQKQPTERQESEEENVSLIEQQEQRRKKLEELDIRKQELKEEKIRMLMEEKRVELVQEQESSGMQNVADLLSSPLPDDEQLNDVSKIIAEAEAFLNSWEENLAYVESLDIQSEEFEDALEDLKSVSPVQMPTFWSFDQVHFPWESCPPVETEESPYLTRNEFVKATEAVENDINSLLSLVTEHQEDVRQWIRSEIEKLQPDTPEVPTQTNISEHDVQSLISDYQRQTETQIDHASLVMGGTVIKSLTSPSIKDSLPLMNRLMDILKLRFYGYGPEAALSATFPADSLGQCWSFTKDASSKFGEYATLAVQLTKPIFIQDIIIEHPPKEITPDKENALFNFRVLASNEDDQYEDLGSFQYEIDTIWSTQKFAIPSREKKYDKVALAIDSNWGGPYTCLYRFQVHGTE